MFEERTGERSDLDLCAARGPADERPEVEGPELEGLELEDPDDDPHLTALIALEAQAAALFVAQCDALLAVLSTTPARHPGGTGRVEPRSHGLEEAGWALGVHPATVARLTLVAHTVQTHPLLRDLLLTGRLTARHVQAAADELLVLGDDALASAVLTGTLASAGRIGWTGTPAELRRQLARTAVALDPDGAAARRAAQTAQRTGVRLRAGSDGLADWTATGPALQLTAADQILSALAASDDPDDPRSRGQRQLDALLGALLARAGSTGLTLQLDLQLPVRTIETVPVPNTGLTEPVTVQLDLTPALLAELTGSTSTPERPAELPARRAERNEPAEGNGHGELDGLDATADELAILAGTAARDGDTATRRLDEAPAGPDTDRALLLGQLRATARPAAEREEQRTHRGTAPPRSAAPATPAAATTAPPPTAPPSTPRRVTPRQGVPELLGHGPLDHALLTELLTDPHGLPTGLNRITLRRVLVDRTGTVVAVDDRARPLAVLDAQRTGNALLPALITGLPTPPRTVDRHDPSAAQTRTVRARDHTCSFPGCTRTARGSDLDHRRPYPDGPTSVANLHPLCRHHHNLKHDGWTCTRTPDGTTTWASPRRQTKVKIRV